MNRLFIGAAILAFGLVCVSADHGDHNEERKANMDLAMQMSKMVDQVGLTASLDSFKKFRDEECMDCPANVDDISDEQLAKFNEYMVKVTDAYKKEVDAAHGEIVHNGMKALSDMGEMENKEDYMEHVKDEYEKHVHQPVYNHDQWEKIYNDLPSTEKYAHNGLHPDVKKRLKAQFDVFNPNNNIKTYEDLKQQSAIAIAHAAHEAKMKALAYSETAAGHYLKTHPEAMKKIHNIMTKQGHDIRHEGGH